MRPIVGFLAVFLTLALASPSIVVTSAAGDPDASQSCSVQDAEAPVVRLEEAIRAEQLKALAERPSTDDAEIVVLNNRGYNYGPAPRPNLEQIQLESVTAPSAPSR